MNENAQGDDGVGRKPVPPSSKTLSYPLTFILLGINILIFMLEDRQGGSGSIEVLINMGARTGALIYNGEYWRLVASIFLHMGAFHLLLNLVSLFIFGSLIESRWGWKRFFAIYLSSGIIGNMLGLVLSPAVSTGSSGAILGSAAALPACYAGSMKNVSPRNLMLSLFILFPYMILCLYSTFHLPGIDVMAHLGGFTWGFLLSAWYALSDVCREEKVKNLFTALVARGILTGAAVAIPVLLFILVISPSASAVRESSLMLARVYYDKGAYEKAIPCYEKILQSDMQNMEALKMLGSSYVLKGEIKKTITLWENHLKGASKDDWLRRSLSDIYAMVAESGLSSGNSKEALELFEKSIALNGENVKALSGAGICLKERGDYLEAASVWKKSAELQPRNEELQKQYRDLLMTIFRIWSFPGPLPPAPGDPKNRAALLTREGRKNLLKSGDYGKALWCFHKALSINPRYAPAYLATGDVYLVLGKKDEAREYFQKTIEITPKYSEAYTGLGNLALLEKDKKNAILNYQKAIQYKRNSAAAWSGLALLRLSEGNRKEAYKLALKARELDPRNPRQAIMVAESGRQVNDERQYFKEMTQALALARNHKDVEDFVLKKFKSNAGG
jgi:membrane associated rhomboid family serine protease/tetratricopeptide (TPR) repeat protein